MFAVPDRKHSFPEESWLIPDPSQEPKGIPGSPWSGRPLILWGWNRAAALPAGNGGLITAAGLLLSASRERHAATGCRQEPWLSAPWGSSRWKASSEPDLRVKGSMCVWGGARLGVKSDHTLPLSLPPEASPSPQQQRCSQQVSSRRQIQPVRAFLLLTVMINDSSEN